MMKRALLSCITALLVVAVSAQTTKRSLHSLLNELSEIHQTIISFSPTLTDKVFPKNTDTGGDLETALKRILNGTDFDYKVVGSKYYNIYYKPQPPKKIVKATPPPEPDTTRFHVVKIDIAGINPHTPNMKTDSAMPEPDFPVYSTPVLPVFGAQPVLAVKTNLLYDATSTINLGVEVGLGKRTTLDLSGNYNPWTFYDNRKMKHWFVQPEFRYWMCSRFSGGFWGIHAHYGEYNWGGMLPWGFRTGRMFGSIENRQIMNHRYEGWLVGGGISYGYHWILGKRWSLEAEIGAGYAYLKYDKYPCVKCGRKIGNESKHYFGPTKAAVNLIFIIK